MNPTPTPLASPAKITARFGMALIAIFFALTSSYGDDKSKREAEFKELSDSRKERKMLVDFLVKKNFAKEMPNGTLAPRNKPDADTKKVIDTENKARLRMFELIAEAEKKSPEQVAREFHQKIQGLANNKKPAAPRVWFTLRGSNVVGQSLAPQLATAFLEDKGFTDIQLENSKTGNAVSVIGTHAKTPDKIVAIKIIPTDSSRGFGKDGLAGKRCDIAMSSRKITDAEAEKIILEKLGDPRRTGFEFPVARDAVAVVVHPENKTVALTVKEIAQAFCGYHREWSSINGGYCGDGEVEIFARSETTGKWASFENLVLAPHRKILRRDVTDRYLDSADIVTAVRQNPRAIGFVGTENIDPGLKVIKVKTHSRGPAQLPTPENLQAGKYPLAHQLYFYLSEKSRPLAREFAQFVVGAKGQKIVEQTRLAALDPVGFDPDAPLIVATPVPAAPPAKAEKSQLPITTPEQKAAYAELTKNADRKSTPTDLQFRSSYRTGLKDDSLEEIDRVISELKSGKNSAKEIIVIGFSDSRGHLKTNQRLSENRAKAVAQIFEKNGLKNVRHAAFGEAMPVESNILEAGRDRNRRVEIWLAR